MADEFVAGSFTATYAPGNYGSGGGSAADIGHTREGFTERREVHKQPIKTDQGGESEVDAVHMGQDILVTLDWVEYGKIRAALEAAEPAGKAFDCVGKLASKLAGPLVLTPRPGTTAAALANHTGARTYHLAVIEGSTEILFSSRLRQGPLTFRCYQDPNNSNKIYTQA